MPTFSPDFLLDVSERLLRAAGVPESDAAKVSKLLVMSNLTGHDSHGLNVLPYYLNRIKKGVIKPGSKITVEKETEVSALVNGNWNFGQLVASEVMDIAAKKAEAKGLSVVAAYNCNHVGRLGEYCEPLASKGLVAIMMVNASPSVAPWGGIERKLGTNPICVAIPRKDAEKPILLDMSTSVVANGKVSLLVGTGERIPEGWAIDKNGKPTSKPEDYEDGGAMLPAAKYKGFGLGLIVDLLCGAWTGSGGSDKIPKDGINGVVALVLRSDLFVSNEAFLTSVEDIVNYILNCRLQKGFHEILLPGQPEYRTMEERNKIGIFVNEALWNRVEKWSIDLGVQL